MKTHAAKIMVVFVASMLVLAGCDKKTTEPGGGTDTKPTFPTFQVTVPAAPTGSNSCNDSAYIYAVEAQLIGQLAAALAALPLTNNNGVWTYTITEEGVTETLTSTRQSDGSYNWSYTVTEGSVTWTAMNGNAAADGSSGSFTIYDDSVAPTQTIDLVLSWQTVATGVELTFDVYDSGAPVLRVVVLANTDGSGEVTEFVRSGSQWVPTGFHATWSGNGAVAVCG